MACTDRGEAVRSTPSSESSEDSEEGVLKLTDH